MDRREVSTALAMKLAAAAKPPKYQGSARFSKSASIQ